MTKMSKPFEGSWSDRDVALFSTLGHRPHKTDHISIYTVKWGTKYNSAHVNNVYEACMRNITRDFEFFCLTDDASDLWGNIEVIPLPQNNYYEKWWNKLHLFDKTLITQPGEKMFLDLDIHIQKNIDAIVDFDVSDCLCFLKTHWHDLERQYKQTRHIPHKFTDLNSSVLRWNDNLDVDKITNFVKDYPSQLFWYYRGLDNMFGHRRERLVNIKFFPTGWAYSYNYGYIYPTDIEERIKRDLPYFCLFDSMERPQDVKL